MLARRISLVVLVAAVVVSALTRAADEDLEAISISAGPHPIEGNRTLETSFSAAANQAPCALLFEQKLERHAGGYWSVMINGKGIGRLEAHVPQAGAAEPFDGFHRIGLAVPSGVLKDGENVLAVTGRGQPAVVRNFKLVSRSLQDALQLGTITVKVNAGEDNRPLPARITVVDDRGQLTKLYEVRTSTNAVRPGILYTLGSGDSFSLPAGRYTLYATRGMEWSVAKQPIVVDGGQPKSHTLVLSCEIDTTGFVACDSHIHTLPGSGHGDATYAERMITIAGEGIEVAIATDHNHISDYGPHQHASGTQAHFHAIAGDEVTTHNGHFTAFPLDPAKAVPGGVAGRNPLFLESNDWSKLIADMREKGAKVVVLNHPYWPTIPQGPFGKFRFDRQTGGRLAGPEFNFDGIELAQPANKTPDAFYAVDDWLALLNRGTRLTAVGATDSHTVNDPVGQARTYLESRSDDVAKIDREDVYRAFLEGRAAVAAGIFAKLTIAEQYTMGDLVPAAKLAAPGGDKSGTFDVRLRVASPSWVRPRTAMIFVNGRRVAERTIDAVLDRPTDQTLDFALDRPPHDAHVVAFVLGDGIKLPGWTTYGKATQAITNPVYLDVDGDEKYSSPRETAQGLIASHGEKGLELTQTQRTALLETPAVKADAAVQLHVEDLLKRGSGG